MIEKTTVSKAKEHSLRTSISCQELLDIDFTPEELYLIRMEDGYESSREKQLRPRLNTKGYKTYLRQAGIITNKKDRGYSKPSGPLEKTYKHYLDRAGIKKKKNRYL